MDFSGLIAALPTEQRLALAYAGSPGRNVFLALLALDARLAAIVRRTSEPLLGQMQLAWWRDQLGLPAAARATGEPLLALTESWGDRSQVLGELVDGWEGLLGTDGLAAAEIEAHANARARVFAEAAKRLGAGACSAEASRAATNWALVDLAGRLGSADERSAALGLIAGRDWRACVLPRSLRPLAVLHGLARRRRGQAELLDSPLALLAAIRLGLTGR